MLTGANGFLGIHILKELLESGHKVLALIRPKDGKSGKERLKEYLEFYFNKSEFENLEILEADITKDDIKADFDTLINAAASVKHFASDDSIERTNLKAARSAVRLIELSTRSIAGMSYNTPNPHILKENELEIGQWLNDNQYL